MPSKRTSYYIKYNDAEVVSLDWDEEYYEWNISKYSPPHLFTSIEQAEKALNELLSYHCYRALIKNQFQIKELHYV